MDWPLSYHSSIAMLSRADPILWVAQRFARSKADVGWTWYMCPLNELILPYSDAGLDVSKAAGETQV